MTDDTSSAVPTLRVRDPLTITIFGASGDLTQRKLLPALFAMHQQGLLPDDYRIVAFARRDYTDASFREAMAQAVAQFSRLKAHPSEINRFCEHIIYHRGDIEGGQAAFDQLHARLQDTSIYPANHLFYLSIKPDLFAPVLAQLKAARLIRSPYAKNWTRVVVEKPFGRDLASAVQLNQAVREYLDESQVYRIDHFLGKETVQNILSFRFANAIFEPLFNNHLVDNIQITAAETVGMESGRGAYYDSRRGAVRDMVQNHLLQLLCLVTMDPPASMTADAIRNEKVKVLQSIVPRRLHDEPRCRCAQSARRWAGSAPGYRQEERVAPDSRTETFAALRLGI
jgi:glucose-6-phosphate 1-dehydrogenase